METRPKAFLNMTSKIGEKGWKQGYRISNANHYYCCDLHCKEHCHQTHNVEYSEVKKIGTINTCQSYLIIIQNIYGLLKDYIVPLPLPKKVLYRILVYMYIRVAGRLVIVHSNFVALLTLILQPVSSSMLLILDPPFPIQKKRKRKSDGACEFSDQIFNLI